MKCVHHMLEIETLAERSFHDLMPQLRKLVAESGVRQGWMIVSAMHTTGAIIVNENEPRLLEDIENVLDRLVPKHDDYLHNDIFARNMPGEPRNAHAHIASMLLGASKTLSLVDGALVVGTWQSVLFVELDGPRRRRVSVQITGAA